MDLDLGLPLKTATENIEDCKVREVESLDQETPETPIVKIFITFRRPLPTKSPSCTRPGVLPFRYLVPSTSFCPERMPDLNQSYPGTKGTP